MKDKYTFPNGPPDILKKTMTYEEFIDYLTDAWLTAEKIEGAIDSTFRKALFYTLDVLVWQSSAGQLKEESKQ